jgi:hypothetical protein
MAPEITSFTPSGPRLIERFGKLEQKGSASEGPMPRLISRLITKILGHLPRFFRPVPPFQRSA